MTEKVCPFMYAGFFEPCIKDECMAWVTEAPEAFCLRLTGDYRYTLALKELTELRKGEQG